MPTTALDLLPELRARFGHETFRPGQEEAIRCVLAGESALAVFPTGAGKSICYQLPAVLLDGMALVVSPLLALMKDQVDSLCKRGIAAARLDSTLTENELQETLRNVTAGALDLLFLSPERLANPGTQKLLKTCRLSFLAVDEAHCLSAWGHNFRPDYLRLAFLAKKLRVRPILALTATATTRVRRDIRKVFQIPAKNEIRLPLHRPNLAYFVHRLPASEKDAVLLDRLNRPHAFPAIVYATLQETCMRLAAHLQKHGLRAAAYHAGIPDSSREDIQSRFLAGELEIVVATIAFGMGIDKADVRSVIHYNPPKSLENYLQESGRAGRDGNPARCEILESGDDYIPLENFVFATTPEPASLRLLVETLLRRGTIFSINKQELSRNLDLRLPALDSVLADLEHKKILTLLEIAPSRLRFRLHAPEEQLLRGHPPAIQKKLGNIFALATVHRGWKTLELTAVESELRIPPKTLRALFADLQAGGDIEFQESRLEHTYRLNKEIPPPDAQKFTAEYVHLFSSREEIEREQLENVRKYCALKSCLTMRLCRFFGDTPEAPCGTCGNCSNGPGSPQPNHRPPLRSPRRKPAIGVEELRWIQVLQREGHPALASPRKMARFLCGISSPATSRDALFRHDAFGLFRHIPFREVLELLE